MVVALVFLTLVACVVADYLLTRRRAPAAARQVAGAAPHVREAKLLAGAGGVMLPEGLYYHPGHTWVAVEGTTSVRIGMDDFARRVAGPIQELDPPTVGRSVRQGLPIWTLRKDGQRVAMLSPVDGVIEEINPALMKDLTLVRRDPYGEGWVARIRVAELGRNLRNLLHGSVVTHWMDGAIEKLYRRFEEKLGPVMADGGMLHEDFSDMIGDEEWAAICREHFLSDLDS